ncbi:hypothetical protein MM213_09105 [Belliella sp. R4-6]|uniref:Uncharacterized protein n=1 Tax=Belliella alkalica TaxID=1730871 RepID=A0ABS9VB31_9BACT|nr:hypothetical protein [Belliella alkalica]MCH7413641.1 hypothetical protein [Belliella alkalica]
MSSHNFTVVAYYDGNCSACYLELIKWLDLVKEFEQDLNFKFILSGNGEALIKHQLVKIGFPLELCYFDPKDVLIDSFPFFITPNYLNSAVLLNDQNEITKIGNPTISQKSKIDFLDFN